MTSHPAGAPDLRKPGADMRAERVARRIFQAADHPNMCAQTCAMIKLLLVVGVAGALTSSADAKIETFGVDRSSDEIGTPPDESAARCAATGAARVAMSSGRERSR